MSKLSIRPLESEDRAWLSDFLREHWGAPMLKPEIALVGDDGIVIHDEIELELMLV